MPPGISSASKHKRLGRAGAQECARVSARARMMGTNRVGVGLKTVLGVCHGGADAYARTECVSHARAAR